MVNNSTNINKTATTSYLKSLNTKKTMIYDVGNIGPGIGRLHWCFPLSGHVH